MRPWEKRHWYTCITTLADAYFAPKIILGINSLLFQSKPLVILGDSATQWPFYSTDYIDTPINSEGFDNAVLKHPGHKPYKIYLKTIDWMQKVVSCVPEPIVNVCFVTGLPSSMLWLLLVYWAWYGIFSEQAPEEEEAVLLLEAVHSIHL